MKYRYLEKAYYPGSYGLIPMEPGDQWKIEGVVRFHLPALLIDIEEHPEYFTTGEISVAKYARDAVKYVPGWDEVDDYDVTEPVVVIEYGPDDWRLLDGWLRVARAVELELETLPAIRIPSEQAIHYVVDESDVRIFIEHWNYRTAYWERRDRMNGFLKEDRPEFTTVQIDAEATWERILQATNGRWVELPTRWNRWFSLVGNGRQVAIGEAQCMHRICPITVDRPVRRKEFMAVFPLYEEWEMASEEELVREKARKITISYEYIFAMIRQYATEKKCDILSEEICE